MDSSSKLKVKITGVFPAPPGLRADSTLVCVMCGSSFAPNIAAGVFVQSFKLRSGEVWRAALCDRCGCQLQEPELLVTAESGGERAMHESLKTATALRRGYILNFGSQ
jgi:hypothetical protein